MLELTPAQAKGQQLPPLGLYIHVPFCATACDYCAFYQTQPTAESVRGFLDGVAREAGLVRWNRLVETVFWERHAGMLAPRALTELGEIVRRQTGGCRRSGVWRWRCLGHSAAIGGVEGSRSDAHFDGRAKLPAGFAGGPGPAAHQAAVLRAYDLVRAPDSPASTSI